jgi:hypothetical protein
MKGTWQKEDCVVLCDSCMQLSIIKVRETGHCSPIQRLWWLYRKEYQLVSMSSSEPKEHTHLRRRDKEHIKWSSHRLMHFFLFSLYLPTRGTKLYGRGVNSVPRILWLNFSWSRHTACGDSLLLCSYNKHCLDTMMAHAHSVLGKI